MTIEKNKRNYVSIPKTVWGLAGFMGKFYQTLLNKNDTIAYELVQNIKINIWSSSSDSVILA